MLVGLMARIWRNLRLRHFSLYIQALSLQNVVVLVKIIAFGQPETNLFVDALNQGLYKMQNAMITVPLSMLGIAMMNRGKLCWPWKLS